MKTQLTSIALGITLAFIASSSTAANKKDWELHEKNWEDTVSYSQIHIADDSAGEWGPWSEFAQPAAGLVVGFVPQTITDPYKPNPQPLTPDLPQLVTYAIYGNGSLQDESFQQLHPGTISVNSTFGTLGSDGTGIWNTSWHIDPDTGKPVPNFTDSGPLSGPYTTGIHTPTTPYQGSANDSPTDPKAGIIVLPQFSEYVSLVGFGKREVIPDYETRITPATGVFVGKVEGNIWHTFSDTEVTADSNKPRICRIECHWEERTPAKEEQIQIGSHEVSLIGGYITGYATPVSVMDSLRTTNVIANYAGNSMLGSNVNVAVNFGSSSWSGQWTGGSGIAFNASGNIAGAGIQGASTTTGVTGTVNGSFFGPAANALAGRTDMTQGTRQTADLFVTTKQ